jgi:hypothetical protein
MIIVISWIFLAVAFFFQAANVISVIKSPGSSQVYFVPVIFWYLALILRKDGFIFDARWLEIIFITSVHLMISFSVPYAMKIFSSKGDRE